MKKFFVTAAAMLIAVSAFAQYSTLFPNNKNLQNALSGNTAVVAGVTSSSVTFKDIDAGSLTQFHVGFAYKFNLVGGFAIQPEVLYNMKGSVVDADKRIDTSVGYLEIPVQFQWGIDLNGVKPYAFAEPFIGYGISTKSKQPSTSGNESFNLDDWKWNLVNRLEYGVGLGAGVEVSRFQISAKYFWNLGNLFNEDGSVGNVPSAYLETFKNQKTCSGIAASLAYFF